MKRLLCAVLLGLLLLCLQSTVWATIPGHIMLDRISDAYPLADGTVIGFAYKTVSASLADTGSNILYIEEPDRSCGIKLYWLGNLPQPARNRMVVVGGTLWTMNGERQVCLDYLLDLGNNPAITPLAMDNPAVGGMDFNALTPGITDAQGPYNKGILARTWGRVTESDESGRYFYIDDGSGIYDGSGFTGIRVSARPGIALPLVNDFVIVTGVSSTYLGSGNNRMIIARDPADIVLANTPTTVESSDAIAYGTNIIGVPGVPFNDGMGSATPNTVFATTYSQGQIYTSEKWNPSNQTWRGITEGYNTVFSDEGYKFDCQNSSVLLPSTGNTVSYQAVLGILEQTDRYVPLYAGVNGSNWIGYPFRTGMVTSYTSVTDGARTYPAATAHALNWMSRFAERWDSVTQGAAGIDLYSAADVYRPWQAVRVTSKKPCALIIPAPTGSLQITDRPDHVLNPCETVPVHALVKNASGAVVPNVLVTFTASSGQFTPGASAVTNQYGVATVNFRSAVCGVAEIGATATVGGRKLASQFVHATVEGWTLQLDLSKFAARTGEPIAVTATLRGCDLTTPVPEKAVTITTNQGLFANGTTTFTAITNLDGRVATTLTITNCPVTATVTAAPAVDNGCATDLKDYRTVSVECDTTRYDDWPQFQHDAQHTSLSTTWDAAGPAMSQQWMVSVPTCQDGRGSNIPNHPISNAGIFGHPYLDSSPIVVGDRVYVGTWTGNYADSVGSVRCYNGLTGTLMWQTTTPMAGVASTPCYYNGLVFVGSADGKLYAINASNGNLSWSRQTTNRSLPEGNGKIISSPVLHNGIVYITNEASKVYAYSSGGVLQAGYPINLPVYEHGVTSVDSQNVCGASSPAIAVVGSYTYLLIGCDDGYLYRLRLNDRQLSGISFSSCIESSPSVSGNYASVGITWLYGPNHKRVTIEPFRLVTTWWLGMECRGIPSISANGHLHVGVDTGRTLFKLDRTSFGSGNILAQFDAGTYFVGSAAHTKSPVTENDWVYSGNDDGWLYGLRESNMGSLWKVKLAQTDAGGCGGGGLVSTSPAIGYNVDLATHNRWLFITSRTQGGKLFGFASLTGCRLTLTSPGHAEPCDTKVTITANYVQNGWPAANQWVTFTTTNGTFEGSGTNTIPVQTDEYGTARAYLLKPTSGHEADVSASAACNSNTVHIDFDSYTMNLVVSPAQVQPDVPASVTATLTNFDATPVVGKSVNLSTTNGLFANGSTSLDAITDANGRVRTTLTFSSCPQEATVTATHHLSCADYTDSKTVNCVCPPAGWTSFQGNNQNTGVTDSILGANLVKKWRQPIAGDYTGSIWSSPICNDSSVWVATNSAQGTIYRFLTDGTLAQSVDLGAPIVGTPCLDRDNGTLFVCTTNGVLHARDWLTLGYKWQFACYNATEQIMGSPKLQDGLVYFTSSDTTNHVGYLYVINAVYGYEQNYPAQISSEAYATPAINPDHPSGPRVYVTGARHLAAFDTSGYPIWEYYNGMNTYVSSPSLCDGLILIGTTGKEMGIEEWQDDGSSAHWPNKNPLSTADPVPATTASWNSRIYFATDIQVSGWYGRADLSFALDWQGGGYHPMTTSPLLSPSAGNGFLAGTDAYLFGFAMDTGMVNWSFDARADLGDPNAAVRSSYAAFGDKMYIVAGTATSRYLYCFGAP